MLMASLCQSSITTVRIPLLPANRCSSSSSSSLMASATTFGSQTNITLCSLNPPSYSSSSLNSLPQWMKKNKTTTTMMMIQTPMKRSSHVVCMAPDEERITRRSPLEFPSEWEPSRSGRRPDILPQFSPMKTPLPPPLPSDPPEEDEFEEKEEEDDENAEPEDPDNPGMQ